MPELADRLQRRWRSKWQKPKPATSWAVTNNHRQIIGYIKRDGTVTNTSRQRIGTLD